MNRDIIVAPFQRMHCDEQEFDGKNHTIKVEHNAQLFLINYLGYYDRPAVTYDFFVEPFATLFYFPLVMGNHPLDLTFRFTLERAAKVIVEGIYILNNEQQCRITTLQHHTAPHASSSVAINGIGAGTSSFYYRGTIAIEKNAENSIARQENKTLLLSAHARAHSLPCLEVHTNKVQCAHGSATGPLGAELIHYGQSRGLSYAQIQSLLLSSMLRNTLQHFPEAQVRDRIINESLKKVA